MMNEWNEVCMHGFGVEKGVNVWLICGLINERIKGACLKD